MSMFYGRDTGQPIEPRDEVHYQVRLAHSGLGGWTWACFCRATGAAPSREEADRAFVRHKTPVIGERTVTTRDGFVTEFNAQSDGEAKAYKAGWADCLAEIGDEDSLIAARVASAAAEAWDKGYEASDYEAYHLSTHGRTDNPYRAVLAATHDEGSEQQGSMAPQANEAGSQSDSGADVGGNATRVIRGAQRGDSA